MRYKVIIPATVEPLTLAEARLQVRVNVDVPSAPDEAGPFVALSSTDDDPTLVRGISSAREWVEAFTGLWLAQQKVEIAFASFGHDIELGWPVQSVESVTYIDSNGDPQTLAPEAFTLDDYRRPALLAAAFNTSWPSTQCQPNAVKVVAVVGPGSNVPVASELRSAMLLIVGELFEKRASSLEVPKAAEVLAWPHRIGLGV